MEYKTSVNLAGVELKNPVMTASGTFGSSAEYGEFYDLGCLGAVVTKGVANVPWPGNPVPRIAETKSGMLNAIGLQNPGVDVFIERDLPLLKKYDRTIIEWKNITCCNIKKNLCWLGYGNKGLVINGDEFSFGTEEQFITFIKNKNHININLE